MSLVNEMLRDLDKRRQSSPANGGSGAVRPSAPAQGRSAKPTRWLPLVLLTGLVLAGGGGLWLYDNPQRWQGGSESQAPAQPAPLPTSAVVAVQTEQVAAPPVVADSVQIIAIELIEQPLQLLITLNKSPQQRILVSTARTLLLDLGAAEVLAELPELGGAFIRSAQFVNQQEHLTLELETFADALFRVVGRNGDNQHRLLLSIEPRLDATATNVAEPVVAPAVAAVSTPAAKPPTPTVTAKSAPVSVASGPVAPLRKTHPQTPEQRDQRSVTRALEQVNRHQQAQARALLVDMLDQLPEASASRALLATLLIGAQQPDQAEQLIDAGLTIDAMDAGLRKLKARLLLQRNDSQAAIDLLTPNPPVLALDTEYHQIKAAALQAAGEHQQAAEAYYGLLQSGAVEPSWWIGLGLSLEALQKPGQAKKAYQNVLKIPQLSPTLADFVTQRLARLGG